MNLTKFKLVNTGGLKGLNYQGDFIPFEAIDDKLAEQLIGKTHVLERIGPTTAAPAGPAIAETAAEAEEAPATGRRARSN
jgi:hypothetical protein